MKTLLILRGAMASGKSTWVKEQGLSDYCISSDDIRIKMEGASMNVAGEECYAVDDQKAEKAVWEEIYRLLAYRMLRGEFCVLDACFTKNGSMSKAKALAERYRYRVFCVDFSDVALEECLRRNAARTGYRRVPEAAIYKAYARMKEQNIPSGITVIKPNEVDKALMHMIDLSDYDDVCHIGDLHGCFTALCNFLGTASDPMQNIFPNIFYIFVGDYFDRGIENGKMANFLYSIKDKPNVLLLLGNHERVLWLYAHPEYAEPGFELSKIQKDKTIPEFQKAGFTPEMASELYQKMAQCAYYTYHKNKVFVCHGGVSNLPVEATRISFLPTIMMIKGVGYYSDAEVVAKSWDRNRPDAWQVFGHRNETGLPIRLTKRAFDLTDNIEAGGNLRAAELTWAHGRPSFHTTEIKNTVFDLTVFQDRIRPENMSVAQLVQALRSNHGVREKDLGGGVSSFNFTHEAFHSSDGFDDPIVAFARGLFLDTIHNRYVVRSYKKFFKVNEKPETQMPVLSKNLKFPLVAYKKENGFLGLVSWDPRPEGDASGCRDGLFVASKSTDDGPFANMFWQILATNDEAPLRNLEDRKSFGRLLRVNDATAVFECIDPVDDPHIIKDTEKHIVLLDIIQNDTGVKTPYWKLLTIAGQYHMQAKTQMQNVRLDSFAEFEAWHNTVTAKGYVWGGFPIEGFVVEDSNGFMIKEKTYFYDAWKTARSLVHKMIKGSSLEELLVEVKDKEIKDFLQWAYPLKDVIAADPSWNIIALRERFWSDKRMARENYEG